MASQQSSGQPRPRMPTGFPGPSYPQTKTLAHQTSNPLYSSSFSTSLTHQGSTDSQLPEQTKTTDQNIARYCRIGQELVHVVVLNSTDLFQVLKATQLPNHLTTNTAVYNERKKRATEYLRHIAEFFKQLKTAYNLIDTYCSNMDLKNPRDLIPFIDDEGTDRASQLQQSSDEAVMDVDNKSDTYRAVLAEHQQLDEQLKMKNMHLKEIIDQLRNLLWEINTNMSLKNSQPLLGSS